MQHLLYSKLYYYKYSTYHILSTLYYLYTVYRYFIVCTISNYINPSAHYILCTTFYVDAMYNLHGTPYYMLFYHTLYTICSLRYTFYILYATDFLPLCAMYHVLQYLFLLCTIYRYYILCTICYYAPCTILQTTLPAILTSYIQFFLSVVFRLDFQLSVFWQASSCGSSAACGKV